MSYDSETLESPSGRSQTARRFLIFAFLVLLLLLFGGFCALLGKYDFNVRLATGRILDRSFWVKLRERAFTGSDPYLIKDPAIRWSIESDFEISVDSRGFTLPIGIAFQKNPAAGPTAPLYYVNEIGGIVQVVLRNREVHVFAADLLNYKPEDMTFTPQNGLMGICIDPDSGDLFATRNYRGAKDGQLYCQVLRLVSSADGLKCAEIKVLLDTYPEITVPSHTIQQPAIGPDGHLYIPLGDAENPAWAGDRNAFAGKILRMTKTGEPVSSNPFFDPAQGRSAGNYVFASGFRNPGVISWHAATGSAYVSDTGPSMDRIVRIWPGMHHGWGPPGTDQQMAINALLTLGPINQSPYGLLVLNEPVLGPHKKDWLLVALFGNPENGAPEFRIQGKRIDQIPLNGQGLVGGPVVPLLRNPDLPNLSMHSITCLAVGPDGIYFTDTFGDGTGGPGKHRAAEGKGLVWKMAWKGSANTNSSLEMIFPGWTSMPPAEKGRRLFEYYSCQSCHEQNTWIGKVGPPLGEGLADRVSNRLQSREYSQILREGLGKNNSFTPAFREIQMASGHQKVAAWLFWHLKEPRFDHPEARMPKYNLSDEEIQALVAYLMLR
jgi:cytochrome c2